MSKFSSRPAPQWSPPPPPPPPPPPEPVETPAEIAARNKAAQVSAARRGISGTVQAGTLGGAATTVNRPTLLGQGVG